VRIAYDNKALVASSITALTADLIFDETNLQNQRLAKVFRTTTPTAQTVVFDLGSAQTINCAAIIGHNLSASSTTMIEGNASDSWISPSVQETFTYDSDMIVKYFTGGSYRYWRFTLDDASNADGYDEVGVLWISDYIDIDPTSLIDFSVKKRRSDTVTYGRGRQKFSTEGVGWRRFEMSFPRTGGTALTNILTLYDMAGNHSSLIFSNFDSLRSYPIVEPVYCSIVGDLSFRHRRSMKFEYKLTLEEDR